MQVVLSNRGLHAFDPSEFSFHEETQQILLRINRLDLSHNCMSYISGLQGLTYLTVLNLSHNGLSSLEGGLPLGVEELDLSHNSIASLQGGALLPLQKLRVLRLSHNQLNDLRGVPDMADMLRELDVSDNRLTSLTGLERCTQLTVLHMANNLVKEAVDISPVLRRLEQLTQLQLEGNPIVQRKRQMATVAPLLQRIQQTDLPEDLLANLSVRSGGSASSSNALVLGNSLQDQSSAQSRNALALPPSSSSVMSPTFLDLQDAYIQVCHERDYYKKQAQMLEEQLQALQQTVTKEKEAAAMLLQINECVHARAHKESDASGRGSGAGPQGAAPAPRGTPPLVPKPTSGTAAVPARRSLSAGAQPRPAPAKPPVELKTKETGSHPYAHTVERKTEPLAHRPPHSSSSKTAAAPVGGAPRSHKIDLKEMETRKQVAAFFMEKLKSR